MRSLYASAAAAVKIIILLYTMLGGRVINHRPREYLHNDFVNTSYITYIIMLGPRSTHAIGV